MALLPQKLQSYVIDGRETSTVDLKRFYPLKSSSDKEELAKDICAIGNTEEMTGYIIVGVNDLKDRKQGLAVPGLIGDNAQEEVFEQQIAEIVNSYIDNPPRIDTGFYDFQGKRICVIEVTCLDRPHLTRGATSVWLRRGTHKKPAYVTEILDMSKNMIRNDVLLEISESIIKSVDEQYASNETKVYIARLLIQYYRNAMQQSSVSVEHRYYYMLSYIHYLLSEYEMGLNYIDAAIDARRDYRYIVLRVRLYLGLAYADFESADRLDDEIDSEYNTGKELMLKGCADKLAQAADDLGTAREMGASGLEYIGIKKDLDRYSALVRDRINRLVTLKEQRDDNSTSD